MQEIEPRSITLKAARINAGLMQEEACKKLHISKYQLSRYENGKQVVPLEVAWSMSTVYKIPLHCLDPGR